MKTDIEIAQSAHMLPINEVAKSVRIPTEEIEQYGKYIAKVPLKLINADSMNRSNLILVTAITPRQPA